MRVSVPNGARTVEAVLDTPPGSTSGTAARAGTCVVACPPHPQHRGSRTDERLRAVSDALVERGVACLRFDYGPWTGGRGEVDDAGAAVDEMRERGYERVGLFGYSFGAAVALLAAADCLDDPVAGVSALAPAARLGELDAVSALAALCDAGVPVQVVAGTRDATVEWEPVADAARERGCAVVELGADHYFVGQAGTVADRVAPFLVDALDV